MWISVFKKKAVEKIEENNIEVKIEENKIPDFKDLKLTETQRLSGKPVSLSQASIKKSINQKASKGFKF